MLERGIALRAIYLWLILHIIFALLLLMVKQPPFEFSTRAGAVLVGVVTLLSWRELRRRNEDLLLANLGVGIPRLIALCTLPPLVLEITLRVLVHR